MLVFGLLLLMAAGNSAHAADVPLDVNSLRGVWLERFTRFIDWPASHRVRDAAQPFELCVFGDDGFAQLLSTLYAKQAIKNKAVRVRPVDAASVLQCDLLFLASVPVLTRDAVFAQAATHHILLVSASPGYAQAGGHINLFEEDGYLRFEVNVDAVQLAGLSVSSHLLKIARVVRQKEGS